MNANTKTKWLGGLLGLCILAIVTESYYLWQQDQNLKSLQSQVATTSLSTPKTVGTAPTGSAASTSADPWNNWDPSGQFAEMQKEMDLMMSKLTPGQTLFSHQGLGLSPDSPAITMQEDKDQYKVVVQVPKGEDVKVSTDMSGNQLTIDGKVKHTEKKQDNNLQGQEVSVSQFSQTMSFPEPIDNSKVQVEQHDNKIVITVPKLS